MSDSELVKRLREGSGGWRRDLESADRIEALAARVAKLEEALNQAAEWFEGYEIGHKHKGDVDKETRNGNRARFCRRAALGEAS